MPQTESITSNARHEEQDGEDTLSRTGPRALRDQADKRTLTPQLHILDQDEGIFLGGMCNRLLHTYDTPLTYDARIQVESLSEKGDPRWLCTHLCSQVVRALFSTSLADILTL